MALSTLSVVFMCKLANVNEGGEVKVFIVCWIIPMYGICMLLAKVDIYANRPGERCGRVLNNKFIE